MNKYGKLLDAIEDRLFFPISDPNGELHVYRFLPRAFDANLAKVVAEEKANYTMNANQNAIMRDKDAKLGKQYQGELAELAVYQFLSNYLRIDRECLHWFDAERSSFKETDQEYDIKIDINNKSLFVDVRSSFFKEKRPITDIFHTKKMDYIPSYTNYLKKTDKIPAISIRAIYSYKEQLKQDGEGVNYNITASQLLHAILNLQINLYIVGFLPYAYIRDHGIEKNLRQNNTTYLTVNLSKGMDMNKLRGWLKDNYLS